MEAFGFILVINLKIIKKSIFLFQVFSFFISSNSLILPKDLKNIEQEYEARADNDLSLKIDAMAKGKRSTQEESETSDHNEHLFHGQHLWGLEDFHKLAEVSKAIFRRKRSQQNAEDEGGDHNEHLFHGQHFWGLEDFHKLGEGEDW